MRAHSWFVEHREDFATGSLERGEMVVFREHLTRCEECRDATAELEHQLRWLPLGVTPVAPPPGLTRRLAAGVLDRRRTMPRWVLPTALAASAVIAAGIWTQERRAVRALAAEVDDLRRTLVSRDARLAATLDTLSSIRQANRVLQTRLAIPGVEANVVVFEQESRNQWTVVVHGLPPAPAGQRYALWFMCEKGMRQGAALPSGSGSVVLVIAKPTDLGAVLSASVTQESEAMTNGMPLSKREIGALTL